MSLVVGSSEENISKRYLVQYLRLFVLERHETSSKEKQAHKEGRAFSEFSCSVAKALDAANDTPVVGIEKLGELGTNEEAGRAEEKRNFELREDRLLHKVVFHLRSHFDIL